MFKSSTFLLILIVALAVGIGFDIIYSKFFSKSSVTPTSVSPSLSASPSVSVSPLITAKIISFSIEPSRKDGGWTMYRNGAKAILLGQNIKSVTVMAVFSGTEMDDAKSLGKMVKVDEKGERWEFLLPKFLLATNFWAEATGLDNSVVKSHDLGNVGYEE